MKQLKRLLKDSNYEKSKTDFLVDGFTTGFDIGYRGPATRQSTSENIPLKVGTPTHLWQKMMDEVKLGRFAGPFNEVPYKNFIQSPVGLVPKSNGKLRLIFHLSFDFGGEHHSLNHHTPDEWCTVSYKDLDHAIRNCLNIIEKHKPIHGGIYGSKTDLLSAFRMLPLKPDQFCWVIMKAKNPQTNETKYFVDKCLPFGASISCALFQKFSDALKHITEYVIKKKDTITNYLDDFLFLWITKVGCDYMVTKFLWVCDQINCPVAMEKTVWSTQEIVFLGMLLNLKEYLLIIPEDKRQKAINLLNRALEKKKMTVKGMQCLTRTLNFLNKALLLGRAFTRRMYTKISTKTKKLKPFHHISLDSEFTRDCLMWVSFLKNSEKHFWRPFSNWKTELDAETLSFWTDASKSKKLGFGCIFNNHWSFGKWEIDYIEDCDPSIEYLELYALVTVVLMWTMELKNRRSIIFCDNQAVVEMVNKSCSPCKDCMTLLRILTLNNLNNNIRLWVKFIPTKKNLLADSLSRLKFDTFWKHAPATMDNYPTKLPFSIWPASKIWRS